MRCYFFLQSSFLLFTIHLCILIRQYLSSVKKTTPIYLRPGKIHTYNYCVPCPCDVVVLKSLTYSQVSPFIRFSCKNPYFKFFTNEIEIFSGQKKRKMLRLIRNVKRKAYNILSTFAIYTIRPCSVEKEEDSNLVKFVLVAFLYFSTVFQTNSQV